MGEYSPVDVSHCKKLRDSSYYTSDDTPVLAAFSTLTSPLRPTGWSIQTTSSGTTPLPAELISDSGSGSRPILTAPPSPTSTAPTRSPWASSRTTPPTASGGTASGFSPWTGGSHRTAQGKKDTVTARMQVCQRIWVY